MEIPTYTESVHQLIFSEDMDKMWQHAQYEADRVLLSAIWFSGARPSELINLQRKDIGWGIEPNGRDFFAMKLQTKKLDRIKGFVVNERILKSSRPMGMKANIYIESMVRFAMKLEPEDYLLVGGRTTRWLNKVMHRLSKPAGHVWSVYHMRHSVLSHMARCGASLTTLMYWKGAANVGSVQYYVHAVPAYIEFENQRRERNPWSSPRPDYTERFDAVMAEREAREQDKSLPEAD